MDPDPKAITQSLTLVSDFSLLSGKHQGWLYADQKKDLEEISFYQTVYEKHKRLQFLPSVENPRIPKVFHFIWLGPKNFPRSSVENARSWVANNPDWTFKFWTDRPRIAPVSNMEVIQIDQFPFQYLKKMYDASDNWGEMSDLLRYEILLREGGVYVDHDMACLRPYDKLVSHYDFFAGLSTSHPRVDGFSFTAINCHFASMPNHPIIRATIDQTIRLHEKALLAFPMNREKQVINSSYVAFTHAILEKLYQLGNRDIVFPNCYFLALGDLPNFYARHTYAGFWRDPGAHETPKQAKVIQEFKQIESSLLTHKWVQIGAIFVLIILISLAIKKRRS